MTFSDNFSIKNKKNIEIQKNKVKNEKKKIGNGGMVLRLLRKVLRDFLILYKNVF